MRTVTVDCREIKDWDAFDDAFAKAFGFPKWYGRNLNAWIDLMTRLDEDHVSDVRVPEGEMVVLDLVHADELKRAAPEILETIFECAAFVNYRRIETGAPPILILSAYA